MRSHSQKNSFNMNHPLLILWLYRQLPTDWSPLAARDAQGVIAVDPAGALCSHNTQHKHTHTHATHIHANPNANAQ